MTDTRPQNGFDRKKLDEIVVPIARAHGAEVASVDLRPESGGWVLRICVEKLGAAEQKLSTEQAAIDLEICSGIARDLSPALDVADLIAHAYNLEIGSPGLERLLRDERDYDRFQGKRAKLKLAKSASGQKVVVGTIGPVDAGVLKFTDSGRELSIPLGDIESGRLVFEFGPAPKPGKKKH